MWRLPKLVSSSNFHKSKILKSNRSSKLNYCSSPPIDDVHSARTATTRLLWKARKNRQASNGLVPPSSDSKNISSNTSEYIEINKTQETSGNRVIRPKRPLDSEQSVHLAFSTDPVLREQYMNLFGGIRVGKILEDLDALAGSIAHAHADLPAGANPPFSIVTASVDRIMLLDKMYLDRDMLLRGFVSYAGTSSMEVRIDMEAKDPQTQFWKPLILANFTMVATQGGKSVPVNPINAETPEEKFLWNLGAENNRKRKEFAKISLQQVPPNSDEVSLVHRLYIQQSKKATNKISTSQQTNTIVESGIPVQPTPTLSPESLSQIPIPHVQIPANETKFSTVEMSNTRLQSIALCQPQERNTAGKVFGGFLMAKAQELAWSCANIYCGKNRAWFVALDHVSFAKAVEIGSILVFDSQVIYTASKALCVRVTAEAMNLNAATSELCTTFYFTFTCVHVPPVIPKSYDEVVLYIEGKRRFDASQEFAAETSSVVLKPHYGASTL